MQKMTLRLFGSAALVVLAGIVVWRRRGRITIMATKKAARKSV